MLWRNQGRQAKSQRNRKKIEFESVMGNRGEARTHFINRDVPNLLTRDGAKEEGVDGAMVPMEKKFDPLPWHPFLGI